MSEKKKWLGDAAFCLNLCSFVSPALTAREKIWKAHKRVVDEMAAARVSL